MDYDLATVIAPIMATVGAGYIWTQAGRSFDRAGSAELIATVALPCLVVAKLVGTPVSVLALGQMMLAAVLVIVSMTGLVLAASALTGLSLRAFLQPLVFSNCGNVGLSVCYLAFGEAGLTLGMSYFVLSSVGIHTIGAAVTSGRASWRQMLSTPVVWAMLLALGLAAADVALPRWTMETLTLIGDIAIPLLLFSLGVSLAQLRIVGFGLSIVLSVSKLVSGLVIGLAVAEGLGLTGIDRGVVVLQASMPVAVFSYVYATRYQARPDDVAGMVVVSTLLTFAALPALLYVATL